MMSYDPDHPAFPTYLLPSRSFPLSLPFSKRHRKSSVTSAGSSSQSPTSQHSSLASPEWSPNTTPSSSPPPNSYFSRLLSFSSPSSISSSSASFANSDTALIRVEASRGPHHRHTGCDTLKCAICATDLAFSSQIVSKGFTGRHGRAYLVSAPNANFSVSPDSKSPAENMPDLINTTVGRSVNRQLVTGAHVVADIKCSVCRTVIGWKYLDAKEPGQRYKIGKFILELKLIVSERNWENADLLRGDEGEDAGDNLKSPTKNSRTDDEAEIVFDSEDEDECDDLFSGTWEAGAVKRRRDRRLGYRR